MSWREIDDVAAAAPDADDAANASDYLTSNSDVRFGRLSSSNEMLRCDKVLDCPTSYASAEETPATSSEFDKETASHAESGPDDATETWMSAATSMMSDVWWRQE